LSLGIAGGVRLSRSFLARFLRRSFRVRRHPYPSLRDVRLPAGSRSGHPGPDTELFVRPSRGRRPSQSELRSAAKAESTGTLRLAMRPRGLFFCRRADATALLHYGFSWVLSGLSRAVFPRYNTSAWRSGVGLCGDATRQGIARPRCAKGASGLRRDFPVGGLFLLLPLGHLAMPPKIRCRKAPRVTPAPLGWTATVSRAAAPTARQSRKVPGS
jgi:hypothetical protein